MLYAEHLTRHVAVSVFALLVPDVSSSPAFPQMLGQCACMNSLSVSQRLREALPKRLRVNQPLLSKHCVRCAPYGDCTRDPAALKGAFSPEGMAWVNPEALSGRPPKEMRR